MKPAPTPRWRGDTSTREAIEAAGADLHYLPPHSLDFNPTELAFAKLRTFLMRVAARTIRQP